MEYKNNSKRNKFLIFISIPVILIIISIYFYLINLRYISTDDAYIKIGMSDISPQISGIIKEVKIENNREVKKGDIIFTIDQIPFLIALDAAKADLRLAVNQIKTMKSNYLSKISDLNSKNSDLIFYKKQYDRARKLKEYDSISDSEFDFTSREYDNANYKVNIIQEDANQQLLALDGDDDLNIEDYSIYKKALADLNKASFDLENTIIRAQYDGVVSNIYIKHGSFATESVPLFSIIDNNDIWIEANFKETELTTIKPGQKAIIEIDSFPGKKFNAKVDSITKATGSEFSILPAQNSSGNWVKVTQRIMVKLVFEPYPEINLSSGMSAIVTIDNKTI